MQRGFHGDLPFLVDELVPMQSLRAAVRGAKGPASDRGARERHGLPATGGRRRLQLGGAYAPAADFRSSRDSTAKSAVGPYNICYINGLQSQAHVSNETSDDFCCNITCMNRYGRACNTVFNWHNKHFFT